MEKQQNSQPTQSIAQRISCMIRKPQFWGFFASIAILAVISFCFFYPDAMQGNELRQHDMQQGAAIGQEAKLHYEQTGEKTLWTNSLFSGMPTFQISPSYQSNSLFSWINTVFGLGLPSPSNLIFMMMAGFLILLLAMRMKWYIALIGAIAYGFSSYFVIIIGAGHIWKFITLAYIPPTIAGIILCYRRRYLLGGALAALFAMMQISSNHVQMSYYFMFVITGIVIAYLCTAIKEKQLKQWGISTGVLAIAGILAVTANLPNLYNTYEYSKETMRGAHTELTTQNDEAQPQEKTSGLNRNYITQYSYGQAETFSLLIPNIKGGASARPEKGRMIQMTIAELPEAQKMIESGSIAPEEAQYLGYMTQYFGEPEGTNGPVYVGALIVALFLLGCIIVKGPMKWVLLVLTLLSILLALGRNCMWLTDLFIDYMPMYNKFRTVESILVIAEFTMPLLAIMALHQLISNPDGLNRYKKALFISFGITLLLCLAGIIMPEIYGTAITSQDLDISRYISAQLAHQGYPEEVVKSFSLNNPRIYGAVESLRLAMVSSDALRSFFFIGLGFIALLMFTLKKLPLKVTVAIVGVLVLADLYSVNKRYLNHESFCTPELTRGNPFPQNANDVTILADTTMNFRVMDIPRFWSSDPSYYHKTIGGYHAAKLTRYQDMIDRHLGKIVNGQPSEADMNILNMLNARYIIRHNNQLVKNPDALGNAWWINEIIYADNADAEMAALDNINPATTAVADVKFKDILGTDVPEVAPNDIIFETTYKPNHLTYHARSKNGGVAIFSEVYFPWGWKAYIDGKQAEIGRVNYILRAIRIPAGEHEISMKFDPDSIHNTVNAAYIAIILIYIALIAAVAITIMQSGKKDESI